MNKIKCIECDGDIQVPEESVQGEIVTCPDCGVDYEVKTGENGVNLTKAESIGEDWGE